MSPTRPSNARRALLSFLLALALLALPGAALAHRASDLLPIVFVHGQSGSAQQFETQAMRFTSNGYPQRLLYAFEYDTSQETNPLADLDAFLDAVLAETGAEQVNAIGHSRGTTVWTTYLDDPSFDGPAKVARYANIDGRSPDTLPGGVPTIGIWGEWNTAGSGFNRRGDTDAQIGPDPDDNTYFGGKSHTEVATSPEAFARMYAFFTGRQPFTTDVVPEPPGRVTIAGRAVLFPENLGFEGAVVELWRVDPATGHRIGSRPRATFDIDASGDFGPVRVNGAKHYELAVRRPPSAAVPFETVHHFYFEPFSRSDHFVRLNSSLAGLGLEFFLPASDEATGLVVVRQREFWGDQGAASDQLLVDGLNVVLPNTSPRSDVNLAVFVYDEGPLPLTPPDGVTDLGKGELFPFTQLTFLTAVDVALAASPDGSGTVSVVEIPRGSGDASVVNVPNWPGATDRISVQFRDDNPEVESFRELVRAFFRRLLGRFVGRH